MPAQLVFFPGKSPSPWWILSDGCRTLVKNLYWSINWNRSVSSFSWDEKVIVDRPAMDCVSEKISNSSRYCWIWNLAWRGSIGPPQSQVWAWMSRFTKRRGSKKSSFFMARKKKGWGTEYRQQDPKKPLLIWNLGAADDFNLRRSWRNRPVPWSNPGTFPVRIQPIHPCTWTHRVGNGKR